MKTTLKQIRTQLPDNKSFNKLLHHLDKQLPDDTLVDIIEVLNSTGLDDTLWCLNAVNGYESEIRLYAVWCARQVQHLMTDKRSLDALDVAERYANGIASSSDMLEARDSASAVVSEATDPTARRAASAAESAVWWVVGEAAWSAAKNARSAISLDTDYPEKSRKLAMKSQETRLRELLAK